MLLIFSTFQLCFYFLNAEKFLKVQNLHQTKTNFISKYKKIYTFNHLPIGTSHVLLNSGLTITTTHVYLCQFHKGSSIPLKRNIITSTKQ